MMDEQARLTPLQKQIVEALRPFSLTTPARLVVGVSGGPDSLALLHLLRQWLGPERLLAAHLDHGLRPGSAQEAEFVAQTAAAWGILYRGRRVDVSTLARTSGRSVEEEGRKQRYAFLAACAREVADSAVVVGHHADDQAETVLLNVLRGSGLAGLGGMRAVSETPGAPEIPLLRPFLTNSRSEIEAYCRQNQLQPRHDESNTDTSLLRNRIRHELLPLLAEYNPQVKSHLQQLAAVTAADYALLQSLFRKAWPDLVDDSGEDWLALGRTVWQALPLSWRRLALRTAVSQLRPLLTDVNFAVIEAARMLSEQPGAGRQLDLPGDLRLVVDYERLYLAAAGAPLPLTGPQLPEPEPLTLSIPGQVKLAGGWVLTAEAVVVGRETAVTENPNPWQAFVDVGDAVQLVVRGRRMGERFQPLGMGGRTASLKDVMIDRKIPQRERPLWPVVAHDRQLVWLVGHQIDERVRLQPGQKNAVRLSCTRHRNVIREA